jgi:Tol biopolymer transport system component
MSEVYRARDTRLERKVAIKILAPEFASDPDRLRRFEHEARSASSLNHPNILTIHDVGSTDSISYIAMELVEGKTLRDLIAEGPLPVKELLQIAVQLTDGLAAAHESGIVHRDLKPSNVMVTREGLVKLLDFGLARPSGAIPRRTADSREATEPEGHTQPGTILGTLGYMSPEQARGERADFRSDQFSLGSILYEMATGRRAFEGRTDVDILAAIVRDEPSPIEDTTPGVPAPLRWIVERCLAKAPGERFASTIDLRHDLENVRTHLAELSNPAAITEVIPALRWRRRRRRAISVAAGLLAAAALLFLFWRRPPAPESMRFAVSAPPGTAFNANTAAPAPVAVTRLGRDLVFGARDATGKSVLWVRSLDALSARPLSGTEGATYPFWSPDGRFVGFFAGGKLKKIAASGGAPQTLCDAPDGRGGSWNRDGWIVFSPQGRGPVYKVADSGGTPVAATRVTAQEKEVTHRWPSFLSTGRHFLFLRRDAAARSDPMDGIWVGSLDGSVQRLLLHDLSNAQCASGRVLLMREGALVAVPFDEGRLTTKGPPVTLFDDVKYQPYRWNGIFSASDSGLLAIQQGLSDESSRLEWFDRGGRRVGKLTSTREPTGLRLSPDGHFGAVEVQDSRSETIDVWIADLARDSMTPLTHGGAISDSPIWASDSSRVVFASNRSGRWKLYESDFRGGEDTEILDDANGVAPTDYSADRRLLLLTARNDATGGYSEIWTLSRPSGAERNVVRLLRGPFNQKDGRLSPDGEWIAYCSDESGLQEVYVRRLREAGGKSRVSSGGGSQPVWRRDGSELFYLGPGGRVMAASVHSGPSLQFGAPAELFSVRTRLSASDSAVFDASPDGQKFLINSVGENDAESAPLTLVLNWSARLGR